MKCYRCSSWPCTCRDGITLIHGDCLTLLPDLLEDAGLICTDPPYGINCSLHFGSGSSNRNGLSPWANSEIANDGDTATRDAALKLCAGLPAVVFGSWKAPKPAGVHTVLVWDKGDGVGAGNLDVPWKPNWEEIYVIGSGFSGRRTTGVLKGHTIVSWASRGRRHPNEKPVSLLKYLLGKCPKHGVVIDPFVGSGATLVAAKQLGRRAIGIDIEIAWCETTANRLRQEVLAFTD